MTLESSLEALHEKIDRIDKRVMVIDERIKNIDEIQKLVLLHEERIKNIDIKVEGTIQKLWALGAGVLLSASGAIISLIIKR